MTIFQIECFLAVAEHLNFAKAAEQLNVSQPAITKQIRTLEEELHTQLFIRNTRMVRLTENGRIFQSDAQVMATLPAAPFRDLQKKMNPISPTSTSAAPIHFISNYYLTRLPDCGWIIPHFILRFVSYRKHISQMHLNAKQWMPPWDSGLQA